MKTIKLLLVAALLVVSVNTKAQVTASFNFGPPPVWAPKNAEPAKFYYLPEIETYYDVPSKRYIYMRNGKWFRSAALPAQYRSYNLSKGQTVYLTSYKGNYPYYFNKNHKAKYYKGNNASHKKFKSSKSYKVNNHDNGNSGNHNNGNNKGNKNNHYSGNSHGNGNNHDGGNGKEKNNGKGKK